jgi:hypothetical protein
MSLEMIEKLLQESLTDEKLKSYVEKAVLGKLNYIITDALEDKLNGMLNKAIEEELKPIITARLGLLKEDFAKTISDVVTERFHEECGKITLNISTYDISRMLTFTK